MLQLLRRLTAVLVLAVPTILLVRAILGATASARRRWTVQFNKHVLNPFALNVVSGRRTYYGVIHHVGRRSGKAYDTPVVTKATADGIVVPLPYGSDTDWCRNVLAAGGCTLTFNREEFTLTAPRVIPAAEAELLVPPINARLWHLVGIQNYLLMYPVAASSEPAAEAPTAAVAPAAR